VIHAPTYFALSKGQELYSHIPLFGPFSAERELHDYIEKRVRPDRGTILFAVIDKTRNHSREDDEGAIAGIIAYKNTSIANLSTEVSYVITLPPFQRTHVASNAVGLLLQYALEPTSNGGLGLRRVQWQANSLNVASLRTAEKMGFKMEGILRWDRVFHGGKARGKTGNGREPPTGSEDDLGRDTVLLSHCWDDWEQGGREKVLGVMDR
jgi:RimJ/RimL family protein N-acetyltransferase